MLADPWISTVRWTLVAMGVLAVVLVPAHPAASEYVIKGTALIAFAIIGISLVVLTGWAGQISLGQMAIVGIGAAVSATFTSRWSVDLNLALVVGGVVGRGSPRSPSACRRCACVACTWPSRRSRWRLATRVAGC